MRLGLVSSAVAIATLAACQGNGRDDNSTAPTTQQDGNNLAEPVAKETVNSAEAARRTPLPAAATEPAGYCNVNSTQWINGCRAECTAGWEGSSCPESCTAAAPPGYVIVDYRLADVSINNGGQSVSFIPRDANFNFRTEIEQAYKSAEEAAGKVGDKEAQARLSDEMSNMLKYGVQYSSSHQLVRLSVNAAKHGWRLNKKRGWSKATVQLRLQCVVPENLQQKLFERYGLQ